MIVSRAPSDIVALDRDTKAPAYRQIYDSIKQAITDGTLRPGERLPSARSLAAQLGTARGTVDAAYAQLAGEGWIVARGAAGTVVAPQLGPGISVPLSRTTPNGRNTAAPIRADNAVPLFRMGLPALDAFPRKLWARLVAREARQLSLPALSYPDPAGWPPLREAIAAYLAIARGIACSSQQVFVTAGFQGALGLIMRTLMQPGDAVWFEDPGYHLARDALTASGATLVPIPVDAGGMRISDGVASAPQARFALVTPSHQSPLGVALSLPRRLALLGWAASAGCWVIEDDYDGEFHYAGRPLPALKSLDRDDVVLYVSSFSKVLFPALRLGYLVVPERLVERFAASCQSFHAGSSRLEQAVVAQFMAEGHFARHLKRMRNLYASRRAALANALSQTFGARLRIELQGGGMHLLARPNGGVSDRELARLAEAQGLAPVALSAHTISHDTGPGLLLSFTNIPETQAEAAGASLFQAIGDRLGTRTADAVTVATGNKR